MNELLTIIFNLFILPFEKILLHKRRKELITNVKGKVLEIGSGGGVNLNYYNSKNIELLNVLDLKFNKFIMNHKLNKEMNINYITANAELWCKDSVFLVGNKINYCRLWRSQSSNMSIKDRHAEDTPFSVYQPATLLLTLSISRKTSF